MSTTVVLDTGGLEAWSRRHPPPEVLAVMEVARTSRSSRVIVPSVVLVETLTGSPRDAPIDQTLQDLFVETLLPVAHARHAAGIRQDTHASAVDAVVAAAAARHGANCVLTSDLGDLTSLLERTDADTVVVAV